MGNYAQLKQAVSNVIKTNGTQAITGQILQNTLLTMINSLGGNFQFVGIATTATNPGTPDQNVFYLAGEGTYTNFSNIVIDTGQLGVLKWNGSWSKQVLEIGSGGGNMILDWNTDVATTRKQVLTKYRKPGIQISYKDPVNGWINEQFVGNSTDDNNWAKDINWLKIANQDQINEIIDDISIINPKVLNLQYELLNANGTTIASGLWATSDYIEVKQGDELRIILSNPPSGTYAPVALYNTEKTLLQSYTVKNYPKELTIEQDGFIRVCGQRGTIIEVNKIITLQYIADIVSSLEYKFGSVVGIEKNINFVGMSIWWYDGKTLADGGSGIGGREIAIGYQTLLKNVYRFLSDTGTKYCYSGSSLGATSEDDSSSICSKMDTWQPSENAIWTLDTITNDFVRNIPLGEKTDYDNNTGKTTYYGALRVFADKITELSGDDKIVIVSNTCPRNGWDTQTTNKNGNTIVDFEKALMYAAVKNKWWFVDQFRLSGITSDTALFTTIDGIHLNNLGYKMAIVPWLNVFRCIFGK